MNVVQRFTRRSPLLATARPSARPAPAIDQTRIAAPSDATHPKLFFKAIKDTANAQVPGEETTAVKGITPLHGTTTLAFIFKGGVLVATDSRSTMGAYISSGTVKKVIEITPYILGTMAGGAADCEFWERNLGRQTRLYELENRERISVTSASKLLASVLHRYSGMGLSVGTMISGFDSDGTPKIYYCDDDGNRVGGYLFSVGSGSTFAYGILENEYRFGLTEAEAVHLGYQAIYHATHRDAASGGMVNVYVIREDGWIHYPYVDNYQIHRENYGGPALPRSVE